MTGDAEEGAAGDTFFDDFNKDKDKQVLTEEVNRKLCEVLTELAENVVDAMAEAQRQAGRSGAAEPGADTAEATADEEGGVEVAAGAGVDEVAAMAAYNDALVAIMQEKDVTSKDMCALPDEHPLKELFFSAFDQHMFHELMERFIGQVRSRKQGPGEWDAEAAEGECDEDHTLE